MRRHVTISNGIAVSVGRKSTIGITLSDHIRSIGYVVVECE